MGKLDSLLEEMFERMRFVKKVEHSWKYAEEVVKVYTTRKVYHLTYSDWGVLKGCIRFFVEENGKYVVIGSECGKTYEDFDNVFLSILNKLYELYGTLIVREDKKEKKVEVYPLPLNLIDYF